MTIQNIRLICLLLADTLSVFVPFFWIFCKEWKGSLRKITGILSGYLIFVVLFSFIISYVPVTTYPLWNRGELFLLLFHLAVCSFLTKVKLPVVIYTLFLLQNVSDTAFLSTCFLSLAFKITDNIFWVSGKGMVLFLCLLFLFTLLSARYLKPRLKDATKYRQLLPVWKQLSILPVLFFFLFRLYVGVWVRGHAVLSLHYLVVTGLFWTGCVLSVHLVSLRILGKLAKSYDMREEYKTSRRLNNALTSQMGSMQKDMDQMVKTRHDLRHHMIALKGLIQKEQTQTAVDYIDSYLGDGKPLENISYCSNICANSLLNYYLETAKEHGVQVNAHISLPPSLPMPDMDFCSILGNLLSNAVEACISQESGTPSLTVNIGQSGSSMITISIRNSYSHEIRQQDGRFLSTSRGEPGIGTVSVRRLAERYHGISTFTYGNGIFEASVLLNPLMSQA